MQPKKFTITKFHFNFQAVDTSDPTPILDLLRPTKYKSKIEWS